MIHSCPRIDHISFDCHFPGEQSVILSLFVFISLQDSETSALMIVDKDISTTDSHSNIELNPAVHPMIDLNHDQSMPPIYRSHIQKRQINLGRYYDGMMRAKSSQLPTHDLRCNLIVNDRIPSEGVTEETVRKGRILLNQIPNSIELKNQLNENSDQQ